MESDQLGGASKRYVGRSPDTRQSDKRMRSSGAVYTQIRVGGIDPTRPVTEMQPDTRCNPRSTDTQHATPGQHHHQQWPESSGQKHHVAGIDGKSLAELSERTHYGLMLISISIGMPDFANDFGGAGNGACLKPLAKHWAIFVSGRTTTRERVRLGKISATTVNGLASELPG